MSWNAGVWLLVVVGHDRRIRFPVFVGEAVDKTEPKDAEVREVVSKED